MKPSTGKKRYEWVIYLLFLLASVHCARSIFYANVSLLDLQSYEHGQERMPFQGRIGMMPVLRWAHTNKLIVKVAGVFDRSLHNAPHMQNPPEDYTPEKLACMLIGTVCVAAMTFAALWFGKRHLRELWWLPGVLTLAMLFTSYASRYEIAFWYPYDLPHFALFGIACLLLMEGMLLPAMVLFAIDLPVRETAIYLVPITLALGYAQGRLRRAITAAIVMCCLWLPVRLWITHHFATNGSDTGIHWSRIFILFYNPLHWPQLASAFAFLFIPLYWGRKYMTRDQAYFLLGAAPCLFVTLLFGIWYESRIWDEWIVPASAILATEFVRRFYPRSIEGQTTAESMSALLVGR